ncbi:MAG: hypothetical protein IH591_15955 [Bacteroidales bacterium]|nr:hypothetical protein [Bacteroidales bacterium]
MKELISLIFVFCTTLMIDGQIVMNPAYGLVSHETMTIAAIEKNATGTVISISLVNMTTGGYFCVDRNTFMVLPDGSKLRLQKAEGIPHCPDVHRFSQIGESISFKLYFPEIMLMPEWFNLVEECGENCFSVLGITTGQDINDRLDQAYMLADSGKAAEAGAVFKDILTQMGEKRHGISGSLYSNIIIMYLREGNEVEARQWYKKMIESGAPDLNLYIDNLSARGIKW